MENKEVLKEGFEFLQPILDNGIDFPFKWNEKYNGYYNLDDDEVLLADGKLYRPHSILRVIMILKYENGEIEKDDEYERLKQWQQSENEIKIVDADGNDASIFNVEKYIKFSLEPKKSGCGWGDILKDVFSGRINKNVILDFDDNKKGDSK